METIENDYSDKGVSFYFVYKALAHPEWDGYVTPYSLDERLMHVAEAERTLGSSFTWLCDTMDNVIKHTMGSAPNSEWIVDENNVIVVRRDWSNPDDLRADLARLVGEVTPATKVEDLDMPTAPPPTAAASGIVPRLEKPGRMRPLAIDPIQGDDGEPFYAKLRVEADSDLLKTGEGKLYIRFMLDPLYNVHWNNLVAPIQVKIDGPDGSVIEPMILMGPKVEEDADIDPREFLIDVSGLDENSVLTMTAAYYACNTEDGWCRLINQSYTVHLNPDRDGGSVINANFRKRMNRMMDGNGGPGRGGRGRGARPGG